MNQNIKLKWSGLGQQDLTESAMRMLSLEYRTTLKIVVSDLDTFTIVWRITDQSVTPGSDHYLCLIV
jgi:hypothetical protein